MKMKTMILLTALLLFCDSVLLARQAMLVEKKGGEVILTNDPAVASGAQSVKPVGNSEVMVFPDRSRKPAHWPRAERILTGIFSGRESEESALPQTEETYTHVPRHHKPVKKNTAETIAWTTEGGIVYHDPLLVCASGSEQVWIDNIQDLSGLEPCAECFIKTGHAPEFISKESGGLDLASAGTLLSNQEFMAWAGERLPIKNPGFISTRRLLIYPKMEMTENGLQQLAKETEMAYRRHTWRVIEVVAKKSETDTDNVSSFADESVNGSTDD